MDPVTSWFVSNFLIPSGFAGIASLFGGKAEPRDPKVAAKERVATTAAGLTEGGEGAYETLMDALAQASDTEGVSQQEIADILGQSGYITSLTGAPGGTTEPTLVEMTQEKINKAASAVGKAQDTVFEMIGIPKPDYSVIQPNAPGGTVIWGQPSGGVFGRIGTTPGGTVTGVQTGIPALDILLGKVADVASGRAAAGDVLNTQTIKDIIVQTAGDELGIPGDPNQVLADIKEIGSQVFYDENTGRLGIDLGDGAAPDEVPNLTPDAVDAVTNGATIGDLPTLSTSGGDRTTVLDIPTLSTSGGDRTTVLDIPTLSTSGGDRTTVLDIPTLSTSSRDRTLTIPDFDPTATERASTLTTDRASTSDRADEVPGGGGGGGGFGDTGGVATVSGGPGPLVDIDYLYDFADSLAQPFRVTDDEDEIEGRRVRRFNGVTGSQVSDPGSFESLAESYGGNPNTGVRGKLSQFVGDNAGALLTSAVGGLFGLLDDDQQQPAGYQGGIPDYTATRSLLPNAFDQTNRRPGSMGRRYFTDTQFTPSSAGAVMQGVGIPAAVAADTGGITAGLDTSAFTSAGTAGTTGFPEEQYNYIFPAEIERGIGMMGVGNSLAQLAGYRDPTSYFKMGLTPSEIISRNLGGFTSEGPGSKPYDLLLGEYKNYLEVQSAHRAGDEYARRIMQEPGEYNFSVTDERNYFRPAATFGLFDQGLTPEQLMQEGGAFEYIYPGSAGEGGLRQAYEYWQQNRANTTATDDTTNNTLTLNAADGTTSTVDLGAGADTTSFTGTGNDLNVAQGPLAPSLSTIDGSDGFSSNERDYVAEMIANDQANIADVAEAFDLSQLDVIEGLLRGDYQTPEQIAATLNAVDTNKEFTEEDLIARLLEDGKTTPKEVAAYYGLPEEAVTARYRELGGSKFAQGGNINGYYLGGPTDGMADQIPATINNMQPAALSDGEFVIPADVVSHLGNGNSDAGAQNLYSMMERVREDRTGNPKQGRQIDPNKYLA